MFEHFTDRSRKVMALANQHAIRRGHPMIDTQHMLLALVTEGSGVGANVLKDLLDPDAKLSRLRLEVEKLMPPNGPPISQGKLPQTPAAKAVIMLSIEEARSLNHNYVGTEHFLLGMLRQADGAAGQALTNTGLTLDGVRTAIRKILGQEPDNAPITQTAEHDQPMPPNRKPWWQFW